ncbi:hypothetical protein R6Q59_002467 [Mikania micrantha]|uniref:GBF-interacting protein 1 N-terminal domain-containing protein n=1 Tax=Mikania micrantha TaxID=192012 RepID=A0A5N6NQ19_9ASTR|nr:hypothetical protein E3N88_19506 [Mikania micrantha]
MESRGAGGSNGDGISPASRKMVISLKEIVDGVTEAEIYSTLKDCNMDPNEAVNRLLSQDHFHEVKSKREKKKVKNTTESRPRGGGSALNRGATHFNSLESSGFQVKPTYKKENGTGSLIISATTASVVVPHSANLHPPTYNDLLEHKNESSMVSTANGASVSRPTSGYQIAWSGGLGQKSMADIVKMGRAENNSYYTTSNPSQQSINHDIVPEMHSEYDHVSPDNDWPIIDQPQAESWLTSGESNLSFDKTEELLDHETNEVEDEDESSDEEHIENHVGPTSVTKFLYNKGPYEHNEEIDASLPSVNANIQKFRVQEEEDVVQAEQDAPLLVIPNHLQVNTADFSHLSFGSFGANIDRNAVFSRPSSADRSETRNHEYYDDGPSRNIAGAENYELPSPSQTLVLKQEDPKVTHGNQSHYGFHPLAHTVEVTRGSQIQISTPFLNGMAAANDNSVRESDLSFSQFSVSQSMPASYASSASSISDPIISMAKALKNVSLSSSQPPQQTLATGPAGTQNLTMHPYSQPTLPLGLLGNMIGYPFLPQNYTYMPSGLQHTFAGNNTYHQQLAAMLPQYKNSVSVNGLPQSAAVASGYGLFGNSTAIPGNYQATQPVGPTGSTISYDDVLNAHYKEDSHLHSRQQNENSPTWIHGGGSRTMPAVPASAHYSLQQAQYQQQQPTGFRQGQQPSQGYGGAVHNYPDFFQSQTGISHDHQLQQNPRDVGSQGQQPKLQSQQLWENGY